MSKHKFLQVKVLAPYLIVLSALMSFAREDDADKYFLDFLVLNSDLY